MRERRFLFITTTLPGPGTGTGERSASIHRALRDLGDTRILLLRHPWHPPLQAGSCDHVFDAIAPGASESWYYRRRHIGVGPFRLEGRLHAALRDLCAKERFDGILCRYFFTAALGAPDFAPSVIDLDDVPASPPRALLGRALRDYRTVFVTKQADIAKVGHPRIEVLPCISTASGGAGGINASNGLLFVGGRSHPPNGEGIARFLQSIWPRIRERVPDATLTLAGAGWDSLPPTKGVSTPGFVPSLGDLYASAGLVICPIWSGAGACVKLAEAAGFGKPVVATAFSAEGYAGFLQPGTDFLAAGSDEEFVAQCVRLLGEPELRRRLGESAAATAAARLSQQRINEIVARAFG